jgi:hypothetical protein
MVYEVKCDNCGQLLEFGGKNPEDKEFASHSRLPDNAVEFDDEVYCRSCVKEFVEFGIGDVKDRVSTLENQVDELRKELDTEKRAG